MDTLRLSDADREAAMDLLSEQYSVGRLTKDEFDERSDAVWSARTEGDLAPVFVDLPVRSPGLQRRPTSARQVVRSGGRPSRRWPIPLPPILFVLIALTVLTHLPFVVIGVVLWFALAHRRGGHHWQAHRSRVR
jgi:hypothetical protein